MHSLSLTVMLPATPEHLAANYIAGIAIALLVLAYLVYSLVRPDKF